MSAYGRCPLVGVRLYYLFDSVSSTNQPEFCSQAEEKKLELAEQYLEEDAAMFDEFLKENDKNSVEAIKVWVLDCNFVGSCSSSCKIFWHNNNKPNNITLTLKTMSCWTWGNHQKEASATLYPCCWKIVHAAMQQMGKNGHMGQMPLQESDRRKGCSWQERGGVRGSEGRWCSRPGRAVKSFDVFVLWCYLRGHTGDIETLMLSLHSCCSAEAETKLKLEKVTEIKKINAQMMAIKRSVHWTEAWCLLLAREKHQSIKRTTQPGHMARLHGETLTNFSSNFQTSTVYCWPFSWQLTPLSLSIYAFVYHSFSS